ncbi:hypothetical protein DTO96_100547 [Ephemeroptericola cinctiostellae]|uniref:Uncharacterized protein n=1 Tax=Ephemeroptericola cinctiostellae TaxID=2268024 RepID=A0A345D8Z9_9BURK|nr:hypothetical protein DTO96_100547 [Ephemeroptericola cinctiostellae]
MGSFFSTHKPITHPKHYKVIQNKTNAHAHCVKKYDMINSFNQTKCKFSAMQTTSINGYTNINCY